MRGLVALCVLAGTASISLAQSLNTRMDVQVSLDAQTWSSSVTAAPGQQVYGRVLFSYIGSGQPVGFCAAVIQPVISNWTDNDTLLPFLNGGVSGNRSAPEGLVSGSQVSDSLSFGRVSPWGRSANTSSSYLRGFVQANPDGSGLTYLRIAQSRATGWFGDQSSLGLGVSLGQFNQSDGVRSPSDPPFNPQSQNLLMFKFGIAVSAQPGARSMIVDIPQAGIERFGTGIGGVGGFPGASWFLTPTELVGSDTGTVQVSTAAINIVPAPSAAFVLSGTVIAIGRRRRHGCS